MNYGLPTTVNIGGKEVTIRTDFRVILDIISFMHDPELTEEEKGLASLAAFYPDLDELTDYEEAVKQMLWFVDGGEDRRSKSSPSLVDWEQDWGHIIGPVNRVLGYEARAVPYDAAENTGGLHWWTFLAAYMEMGGDCVMAQIVSIRDKQKRGKKLEKHEREWYRRNKDLVDFKQKFTEAEDDLIKEWT